MKIRSCFKPVLPATLLAASIVAGIATYAPPAHSCSWTDPWNCFDDLGSWIWDGTKSAGNWFKDLGLGIGRFAVRDLWGNVITTFACPYTTGGAYGTTLACFPYDSMQEIRILGALHFLATDTRNNHTYVTVNGSTVTEKYFQPSSFSIGRIAYILDGYQPQASVFTLGLHDEGSDATSSYVTTGSSTPVVVWPSAYTNYVTDASLAGVLVHEAEHTRFGAHSCGDAADMFEDGPYGTEIQYFGKLARTGHPAYTMSEFDRGNVWDKATAKLGQICDEGAQKRLWNTYLTQATLTRNPVLAAAFNTWQQATPGAVTDISAIRDGRIFGIGFDGVVYQSGAGAGWVQATLSPPGNPGQLVPQVTDISVTNDGIIYGLGTDGAVYRSISSSGGWVQVTLPWVQKISVTPDGTIYAIGGDNAVYRMREGEYWQNVAPPWVQDISVTPDGTIYGLGGDNAVYRSTPDSWYWDMVAPAGLVTNISVTPSGFIYGVGTDRAVYMTRWSAQWQKVAEPSVGNISVAPDGMIYGVGDDNAVWVHGSKR